jgi:phosphatidyl-myo-inositol alpha-mannosyltransferase
MAPLRVALVCPYSWSVPGGVQTHVGGLARALRRRGAEVEILAPADGPVDEPEFIALGRTIALRDNGAVVRLALGPAAIARTAHHVRTRGYDLVHLHEPMLPHACFTALHSARVPVLGTFHLLNVSDRWYRLFGPLVRRSVGRLRARIAVSEAARDFVAPSLPGDYRVIPNALDVEEYASVVPGTNDRDCARVLFVGRPEPRKGLPVLLDAFARLPEQPELELVGVGPEELAAIANGLPAGVASRVRAHGRVPDAERRALMARADVLCAPSLGGESFGLVVVEGMAAGLPVVVSDIPGYRDVLPPGAGLLVPPRDAEALAATLGRLLADPELRSRLAATGRRASTRFDWSVVADEVVAVYEEVLAG